MPVPYNYSIYFHFDFFLKKETVHYELFPFSALFQLCLNNFFSSCEGFGNL